jgi:hypothetical protein
VRGWWGEGGGGVGGKGGGGDRGEEMTQALYINMNNKIKKKNKIKILNECLYQFFTSQSLSPI